MKLFDITLKDLRQASRNRTIYFFMFVVPVGISLLFMLMFGGIGDDEGFQMAPVQVLVVNQDQGEIPGDLSLPGLVGDEGTGTSFDSMGELLVEVLKSPDFSALLEVSEIKTAGTAREAVDNQEAGVAVILPGDFTDSLMQPDSSTAVEIYKDPTLSIGPQIVEAIVTQILDNFDAATIGLETVIFQLAESGVIPNDQLVQEVAVRITSSLSAQDEGGGAILLVSVQPPTTDGPQTDLLTEIVGTILGGMIVFFAFFTAASTVETILVEEERGTLARLFTTPTSHRAILGGKGFSAVIILIFQLTVLMAFGAFLLGIYWGTLPTVLLAALGIILVASATGLFLVSLMQNTRQGGIIFGGVLTMTGMLGLIPVFTSGNPDQPEALNIVSLLVPQGWAMRGLGLSMDGASISEMLPVFGVIVLWTFVLFFIGQHRMRKRFA